ncbi:hypothetical protein MSAN_00127700 [Mycena sanguinolenta]|uniref:Protein kinase domain-containing protein n=1 Tax=Mycena sanguinolenta TaxID=230812 RepID=A0A8H6ZIS8_9AGAR|nr:hypothetical protein MSAN_00127700 [Mycena sanguinolenta]
MDPNPDSTYPTTSNLEFPSHASGMFSHSHHFTVTGKTFTNITNNYVAALSLPPDFRMIPLGDIDLRHEIGVGRCTSVVNYQPHKRACVRRFHSATARIDGRRTRVTAAIYQGNGAEEEWRREIAIYMSMRHPNILQLCSAASASGIHAMLFNDDLIPLRHFLDGFRNSPVLTVYIYACCNSDFSTVHDYIYSAFQQSVTSSDCTRWIRRSTGRLCAELTPASDYLWLDWQSPEFPALSGKYSWSACTDNITMFIDSLALEEYHRICTRNLSHHRRFDLSPSTTVNFGAAFRFSNDQLKDSVEIAFSPSVEAPRLRNWTNFGRGNGEIMPDGWTRFQSGHVFNNTVHVSSTIPPYRHTWLSQANHIFRHLHITSNFEDYVAFHSMNFVLSISGPTEEPPAGFLFLCPVQDFQTGPFSFCWPACPAYWSLDPSGIDRLSPEYAAELGFPPFELIIKVDGYYWDAGVYDGLRQFHKAKGFDPYSQDVARHLGIPLYQISYQADAPFDSVNSEDEDFEADIDLDGNSVDAEQYEAEYPPTSTCDDSDVKPKSSHDQETFCHSANGDGGSDHAEISNCENYDGERKCPVG